MISLIKNTIQKLVDENYAVIYITENASMKVNKFISKFQTRKIPAIVTVPGNSENLRYGETRIKEMCKNAVGIEISCCKTEWKKQTCLTL